MDEGSQKDQTLLVWHIDLLGSNLTQPLANGRNRWKRLPAISVECHRLQCRHLFKHENDSKTRAPYDMGDGDGDGDGDRNVGWGRGWGVDGDDAIDAVQSFYLLAWRAPHKIQSSANAVPRSLSPSMRFVGHRQ